MLCGEPEALDPSATGQEIAIDMDFDTIHVLVFKNSLQNTARQSRDMDRIQSAHRRTQHHPWIDAPIGNGDTGYT
jgi:hypothetical protein